MAYRVSVPSLALATPGAYVPYSALPVPLAPTITPQPAGSTTARYALVAKNANGGTPLGAVGTTANSAPTLSLALATPAAPSIAQQGAAGTATARYAVAARNANGTTMLSTVAVTSTSNAVLSTTNYNALTWAAVAGATSYDVWRLGDPGLTPATIGKIGSTSSTSFNDTGLPGDGSAPPSANTTAAANKLTWPAVLGATSYDVYRLGGDATLTPSSVGKIGSTSTTTFTDTGFAGDGSAPPTVDTTGGVVARYGVAARNANGSTPLGSIGVMSTSPPALTASSYNPVSWVPVAGATSYDVWRLPGDPSLTPSSTGKIGNTGAPPFNDTGLAGDGSTPPVLDATGILTGLAGTTAVLLLASAPPALAAVLAANPGSAKVRTLDGGVRYFAATDASGKAITFNDGATAISAAYVITSGTVPMSALIPGTAIALDVGGNDWRAGTILASGAAMLVAGVSGAAQSQPLATAAAAILGAAPADGTGPLILAATSEDGSGWYTDAYGKNPAVYHAAAPQTLGTIALPTRALVQVGGQWWGATLR